MKIRPLALICGAVLCVILTLGLWPFHSPINDVTWLKTHDGLHFGPYGTAISYGTFQITPQNNSEVTLEVWLQPKRIWDSGTFLAFYKPGKLRQFSLRQSQTDLLLKTEAQESDQDHNHARTADLDVNEAFRRNTPVFLTITAGIQGTSIYIDGVLAVTALEFPLSAKDVSGRLVLGDSPGQTDSWSGEMRGLAIYHRKLTTSQVFDHFATWKQAGQPEIALDERNIVLYLFHEHSGGVARDRSGSGMDLYIPKRYQVMDKIVLEPFWTEFAMTRSYWGAALKNIAGFIPVGFCFYAYLATVLTRKRAALVTIFLGTAVSFTIEILQAFLPTRDSGTTDLITNTIGTWVGVSLYNLLAPILPRLSTSLPFPSPRLRRSPEVAK